MTAPAAIEVAFLNATGAMDAADFAFACAAAQVQLERDFLPVWSSFLPVKAEYVAVGYDSAADLKPGSFDPIEILPELGDPGVLGDHSGIEATGTAYGRSLAMTMPMLHELLELVGDPYANRWVRLPSGIVVALENVDPVEMDSYVIDATVGSETRPVQVPNFVHPAWFGEGGGTRYDHLGLCSGPGENRGYIIVANPDGTTDNVFADRAPPEYRARVKAKLRRFASRTAKRHLLASRIVGSLAGVTSDAAHHMLA